MNLQPDLFDRVNARHTDPESSALADQAFTASGEKEAQAWAVLQLVARHQECTALELSEFSDLDRYQIQKRLSDLKRGGYVTHGARSRACRKSGRPAVQWWITLTGRNALRAGYVKIPQQAKKSGGEAG